MTSLRSPAVVLRVCCAVMVVLLLAVPSQPARAQTFIATTNQGLIDAINSANRYPDPDTILLNGSHLRFNSPLQAGGSTALPEITTDITILGGDGELEVSGSNPLRLFDISSSGRLALSNIRMRKLQSSDASSLQGGFVFNQGMLELDRVEITYTYGMDGGDIYSTGTLIVKDSWFHGGNSIGLGGAIYSSGSLTVSGSLFENLRADHGSAIFTAEGQAEITNSTFEGMGPGIGELIANVGASVTLTHVTASLMGSSFLSNEAGTLVLRNTLIGNAGSAGRCIEQGQVTDGGGNLVDFMATPNCSLPTGHPGIRGRQDNGGPTQTFALEDGSDALEHGNPAYCLDVDQRGVARSDPPGTPCDSGAFESPLRPTLNVITRVAPQSATTGEPVTMTWTLSSPNANSTGPGYDQVSVQQPLPAGLYVRAGAVNGCGGTLYADEGSNVLALIGGFVPEPAGCQVQIPLVASQPGTYRLNPNEVTFGSARQTGLYYDGGQLVVTLAAPRLLLILSEDPAAAFGSTPTLRVMVQPPQPEFVTPSGLVQISVDASLLSTCQALILEEGVTSCVLPALSVGEHTIQASYGGDNNYPVASESITLVVNKGEIDIVLSTSPWLPETNQPVTLSAHITPRPPAAAPLTGLFSFTLDGSAVVTCQDMALTNDRVSCEVGPLAAGAHTFQVSYLGSDDYAAASQSLNFPVNQRITLTALDPGRILARSARTTLSLTGLGFVDGAVVRWNGVDLATEFINPTTLTANVPADLLAQPGTAQVKVVMEGEESNSLAVEIAPWKQVFLPLMLINP